MSERKSSRKYISAAAKQMKDVQVGEFVRLKGHRGLGVLLRLDQTSCWARVRWQSGEKAGTETDHSLISLRLV